jgi:molybdopterin/thiamine biosynthesis adenylyltransferase/rhodanese-related sulfurtransferase
MSLTSAELARYSRHLSLADVGVAGQERLQAARALVIGAGGLGSPALLYLAAAGVGTIGIVDFDTVDVSNLQRQVLFDSSAVGTSKAATAATRLQALNPHIAIHTHAIELRAANVMELLREYDLVLDGTDRFATRYLVNDACVLLRKPLVSAAIHRFEGQAFTYVPERGPCYRCLFPEPPGEGLVPNCAEAGVLGVLPGVMGTIQATEAIKLIIQRGELLLGRLLTYDALEMRFAEFRFERRTECAVCGAQPTITRPQDPPELCAVPTATSADRMSAMELRALLVHPDKQAMALIDVREPYEFAAGHLPAAINIPLSSLNAQWREVAAANRVIFICRSGARSAQACQLARERGIQHASNLAGGMLAWAKDVDNTVLVA